MAPQTAASQPSLSFTISQTLLRLIESVMLFNHLNLCHSLLLPLIFPSIRIFSSELALCIKGSNYWSSSFSISPSNEYSGLTSFRTEWFDFSTAQITTLPKHQIFSAQPSFMAPPTHLYMTTGKTMVLTIQTFVGLLFNMLSRFVLALLPKSKCLLISCLQSPSTVILERKSHCFHFSHFYLPWSNGTGCCDLSFFKVEF